MAEIGPQWSPAKYVKLMLEKFSEIHRPASTEDIDVRMDLPYGTHPRQRFDIYLPAGSDESRAAVLFAHGGAFLDGHRNRTDEIYANVLRYFARNGVVGINIGYRLADDTLYPGATEDVAAVVAWAHEHASEIGIDRNRIFLMGHSAGAAHTGSYAYDKRHHPAAGPGLAGHLVISGRVRAETRVENPNAKKVVSYYGTDNTDALADFSPVSHIDESSVPTFVAWAEFENPLIDVHCAELCFRLAVAKRRSPPSMWLRGHNHTSSIGHINTAEDELGLAMLDFISHPR
ncbi:alpha/beta hydrolase [Bradyrhizobium sp. CCGB12]|uniref:alpha/beta hydrolase n=1 Tax=Bradyrhizobium sp. CCGB12 TaxID=2949632 RepID=UPI0020B2CDA0|nr:alpha/beta hydrolase [Bradyrhizobium sp. CCGB12]MCP3395325.1 alpha/beta hydrolase [Bradyrhizobium sp. CCGB12]